MFEDSGSKIQGIAKSVCIAGMIVSIITGVILMTMGNTFIVFGLLIIIFGSASSWVSALFLYCFGGLSDDIQQMRKLLEDHMGAEEQSAPSNSNSKMASLSGIAPISSVSALEHGIHATATKSKPVVRKEMTGVTVPATLHGEYVICSHCKSEQPSFRKTCWTCGATFGEKKPAEDASSEDSSKENL